MLNIFDLIGRILISVIFLLSGFNKITNYEGTILWMEGFGLQGFLLIPAIILEITASILIIIGYQVRFSAGFLAIFCIGTAIIFHNDFSNQMQLIAFMKNFALAGGFLFLVTNGAKDFSIDKKFRKE